MEDMMASQGAMKQLTANPTINVIPAYDDLDDDETLPIAAQTGLQAGQSIVPSFALSSDAQRRLADNSPFDEVAVDEVIELTGQPSV